MCTPCVCDNTRNIEKESQPPTRGEREQRHTNKDSSRLSSSLIGTTGLQEYMAGLSQSDLECMKILLPRLYAETLVSARFLCAESDLLGFTFGNELVPLSSYVDRCAHRNCRLQWPGPSEVTENSSFV